MQVLLWIGLLAAFLYICHADFTLSKIRSSCHWVVSLREKGEKIMPNQLEDISARRLRKEKKSFPIFNGSFIALIFCSSFFL